MKFLPCSELKFGSAFAFVGNSSVSINYRAARCTYHFLGIFTRK